MGQRPDCSRRFVPGRPPHRDGCPGSGTSIPMEPPRGAAKGSVGVLSPLCGVPLALLQVPFFFWNQNCIHFTYVCLVSLCLDRCSAILCCTHRVPTLSKTGTHQVLTLRAMTPYVASGLYRAKPRQQDKHHHLGLLATWQVGSSCPTRQGQ